MVFVSDDVEASLIAEGREVWRITGKRIEVGVCGNADCEDYCDRVGPIYPAPGVEVICPGCGEVIPPDRHEVMYECSECEAWIEGQDGADEFLRHAQVQHPPTLF